WRRPRVRPWSGSRRVPPPRPCRGSRRRRPGSWCRRGRFRPGGPPPREASSRRTSLQVLSLQRVSQGSCEEFTCGATVRRNIVVAARSRPITFTRRDMAATPSADPGVHFEKPAHWWTLALLGTFQVIGGFVALVYPDVTLLALGI